MDMPVVVELDPLEVHEPYIDILDRQEGMRVVTTIEVVSPTNKSSGAGRNAYLQKQRNTLASETHLIEIDLLRHGQHLLAVPPTRVRENAPYHYLMCVSRATNRRRFEVYPNVLRDRLPRLRVPLAAPDADVPLDLQAALEYVYEDGDYGLRLRYDQPCVPALSDEDQRWADDCGAAFRSAPPDQSPSARR
jgi:hypothetical protein